MRINRFQEHRLIKRIRIMCFLLLQFVFPSLAFADGDVESLIGRIDPPPGVDVWQDQVGDDEIAIILFLSNIITLITIVAGIWTMLNFIMAGWIYITSSGDSSAGEKVATKMTNSVMGLAIVALSYTIAGIIGYLIFGDATFIINPKIQGPG